MSVQTDHVAFFRTQWATRFVDSITIDRTTSRGSFNATTGDYDTPVTANQYTGNALIRPASTSDRTFGDQTDTRTAYMVYVPNDTTGIQVDDIVNVVASTTDPELDGVALVVRAVEYDTYKTHLSLETELDITP